MIRFSLFKLVALIFLCLGFYYIARWQIILHNNGGTGSGGLQQRFLHTCNLSEPYRNELEQLFERFDSLRLKFWMMAHIGNFEQGSPDSRPAGHNAHPVLRDALGPDPDGEDAAMAPEGRVLRV